MNRTYLKISKITSPPIQYRNTNKLNRRVQCHIFKATKTRQQGCSSLSNDISTTLSLGMNFLYLIRSTTQEISKLRLVKGAATLASASDKLTPTSAAFKAPQSFAPSPQNPTQYS